MQCNSLASCDDGNFHSRIFNQLSRPPHGTTTSFRRRPGSWDCCVPISNGLVLGFKLPHDVHLNETRELDAPMCMNQGMFSKSSSSSIISATPYCRCGKKVRRMLWYTILISSFMSSSAQRALFESHVKYSH